MTYYQDDRVTLHHGDALEVARSLPDALARTIVTSPPYFGLRDYGVDGQVGGENTPEEFVATLVSLFHELGRVLTDDGTLWLNLGDSYSTTARGNKPGNHSTSGLTNPGRQDSMLRRSNKIEFGVPHKNLLGIPWRVALALQADGWILRSEIIWQKPNPMPESVTDRPTSSHEHIFLLTKSERYYYDAAAVAENVTKGSAGSSFTTGQTGVNGQGRTSTKERIESETRNARDVWSISTVPFPGAHFAVFPPELPRRCIAAGSAIGDTVLDPFSGSGTTGKVALDHGRNYVGIDLNSDYLDLSLRERFQQAPLQIWGNA